MSSPTPQVPCLECPHSLHDTAPYLAPLAFRLALVIVALWSVRFTIQREHAWATVEDCHRCAPLVGVSGKDFGFGCDYRDVSVVPSLLHQSYLITVHRACRNNSFSFERRAAAIWLLYLVAAFAVSPNLCLRAPGTIGPQLPARHKG